MYTARHADNIVRSSQASTPELDVGSIIDEADDVDVDVDVVVDEVATQKPHFLDYDAVPPPDFEESFDRALSFGIGVKPHEGAANKALEKVIAAGAADGELRKLDKKYERDGEISDYELAASGYTKKEFTQDDNTLHMSSIISSRKQAFNRPKHFLDENPIPPDYMLDHELHELREHRSLDRNFERQHEHEQQRTVSPPVSLGGGGTRKSSVDRGSLGARSSRDRFREPSYTLSRFLDNEAQLVGSPISLPPQHRLLKGAAWTDSFDNRFGSLQLPSSSILSNEIDTLGPKVECVYSLLSMLGSNDPLEMSKKFLELSRTPETCVTLRRSGCIPLLVQMMHSEGDENVRKWAGMALHNVVHSNPDEKAGRREAKVLRLLDQIIEYCNFLKTLLQSGGEAIADDSDRHPLAAISSLMKVSFDEEHRHAMCELGGLQAIPSLVHLDHAVHGPKPEDQCCNSLRRYALMALTNLTFGDENNKALLCSQKLFMEALVFQLDAAPDDLLQVTASVLRNLSWRADSNMKAVLNEIGTVTALARAAMKNKSENTLKAILSALWNLSAHCSTNKAEFCAVDGALAFLVDMLTYEGPSKTLKIIENAGGILRNVSSHIAVREHYRQILRERNCLAILLQQLKSESLTVVSNSCGTLWNLSARCPEDQKFLWDNGAVPMLRSLINSKHAMISEGSSSALKNLLNFRPSIHNQNQLDPIARSMGLKKLPTLNARKQKALEQELGEKEHAETCDNLDIGPGIPKESVNNFDAAPSALYAQRRYQLVAAGVMLPTTTARLTRSAMLTKSESRDSVLSAKSDSVYENLMRSHSASDDNRCTNAQKLSYAAVHVPRRTAFALQNDVEPTEERPIDYSVKYNEHATKRADDESAGVSHTEGSPAGTVTGTTGTTYATYQETDLDQPTDFSLRYAENQIESDVDILPPEAVEVPPISGNDATAIVQTTTEHRKPPASNSNEILLILEDSVKCYQTEDTPYVISNAASVTDLRQVKLDAPTADAAKPAQAKKYQRALPHQATSTAYGSGSYTPEKPVNYCEEGTPGYFSRYESLSSLDDSPPQATVVQSDSEKKPNISLVGAAADEATNAAGASDKSSADAVDETASANSVPLSKQVDTLVPLLSATNLNSAQETPLMFSRHSSMDSLAEEDVGPCDDKSSVLSDFSRLASGIISPSEIPDSPTQSMPQSPRRHSAVGAVVAFSTGMSPVDARGSASGADSLRGNGEAKRPLRSVFEDNLNTFHVENTPAQFSCATSLSNLSILDEEHGSTVVIAVEHEGEDELQQSKDGCVSTKDTTQVAVQGHAISEGEEEEEESGAANIDDLLLASCINIGMNRTISKGVNKSDHKSSDVQLPSDEPKQYFTEDTPALLSKVGSNTNLSAISICSSINELTAASASNGNRNSAHLVEDISSNASESGMAAGQTFDLLQQCIRDGMQKPTAMQANNAIVGMQVAVDPIAMMRRGGRALPPYLPVSDDTSKYLVEDSPCNFSVMSGLSNLTVGSSLVGPAVRLNENASVHSTGDMAEVLPAASRDLRNVASPRLQSAQADNRREPHWQDDSLSSLSIDSEDDTNLLSQAIAAGCNRPKSNLGFSTTTLSSKRSTSLSASQPIPINAANSASYLNSRARSRNYQRQQQQPNQQQQDSKHSNGNESHSSVDSSDSNDNQSKSLLELCILSGMHKTRDLHNSRKQHQLGGRGKSSSSIANTSTQSNPNLKQYDAPAVPPHQRQHTPSRHLRERERKDEKLLLECINTGITKKIGGLSGTDSVSRSRGELLFAANAVPKNGQATSAAALAPFHPTAVTTSPNAKRTAVPDVEKNNAPFPISTTKENETMNASRSENENGITTTNSSSSSIISPDDITNDPRKQLSFVQRPIAVECAASPQSLANVPETLTNGIGCKEVNQFISLENITSDESNQSFIMETTVSLVQTQQRAAVSATDKHKDPDLMLKSVERLTLEFVTSAEQLRTNGSSDSANNDCHRRLGSLSVGGSNSNNTWNEDTCPNDVSFPSVSVSAPVVASLNYEDDDEDEQATEADHKELHDFAEITPTNEEQPPSSLGYMDDHPDMYGLGVTQPNSLETETETDTLVRDDTATSYSTAECNTTATLTSSSGINFQLGGEVQTAAAATALSSSHLYFQHSAMTDSTIMAIEARTLADNLNLQQQEFADDNVDPYSFNSLDLDNIRPPSGMESLNISGYYQELSNGFGAQPHSLPQRCSNTMPHSPHLLSSKSPKFPRKLLPAGLMARRALGHLPAHLGGSTESVNSSCNLLDNVKPPSLMDELLDSMISVASIQSEVADCDSLATTVSVSNYETAAVGGGHYFDDNTITLQSCYSNTLPYDEDDAEGSLHSGTPLPSDCDFSSAETTPRKTQTGASHGVKRNLTPKQKRKVAKDRFKTYTIAADLVLSEELRMKLEEEEAQQHETLQIEIVETTAVTAADVPQMSNSTSASPSCQGSTRRRRCSQDRYKTQTIVYAASAASSVADEDLAGAHSSLTSTDDCASDDVSSIRAMTKQFKFISTVGATAAATLPTENEYTSLECEQNSETESCHGQFSDPENETSDNIALTSAMNGQAEQLTSALAVATKVAPRPRITKPGDADYEATPKVGEAPAIRGRKKVAYVSPYSMQFQRSNAPLSRLASNKSLLPSGNAHFRQRNGPSNTSPTTAKLAQKSKKTAEVAVANTNRKGELPPLERQGTFVQDEPTIAAVQVPVVEAACPSAASSAQSSPTRHTSKLPTKQRAAPATARKLPVTATSTKIRRTPAATATAAGTPQRSNSNASMRVTSNAMRMAMLSTRISATTPPSRSNSSLSGAAAQRAAVTATTKTIAAQSRIAGIWKRVDEARVKQRQTQKPSSPIARKAPQAKASSQAHKQQQLIRSTTFDNMPEALTTSVHNVPTTTTAAATKMKAVVGAPASATGTAATKSIRNMTARDKDHTTARK